MLNHSQTTTSADMPELLITGDMIGDKKVVKANHVMRAQALFAELEPRATDKFVIAVGGPSGSGKSEIASLIGTYFIQAGKGAYVISCDNYPHLPPKENDALRLKIYGEKGIQGLQEYLGTQNEINFQRLSAIVQAFKRGEPSLALRQMDVDAHRVANDAMNIDVSKVQVLVLEGTWSNLVEGCDSRVFLRANPRETRAHRQERGREEIVGATDRAAFIEDIILPTEQAKLDHIALKADLVAAMDGTVTRGPSWI